MFGFSPFAADPYSAYRYPTRPQQTRRQMPVSRGYFTPQAVPQPQSHYVDESEPLGAPFGAPFAEDLNPFGFGGFNTLQRQREREQALAEKRLRQQQERERLLQEKKQLLQKQQREAVMKKLLSRRNQRAATVIQRAWRAHHAQIIAQRRQQAAFKITKCIRGVAAQRQAMKIVASLKQVRAVGLKIQAIHSTYEKCFRGFKQNLGFTDAVEKQLLTLDGISTYGSEIVRDMRKKVVALAQGSLKLADFINKMMHCKATIIQRQFRAMLHRKQQAKRRQAAEIVHRVLLAAPQIRRAQTVAKQLRQLRQTQLEVAKAQAAYRATLLEALKSADSVATSNMTDNYLLERLKAMRETCQRRLQALELDGVLMLPKAAENVAESCKRPKLDEEEGSARPASGDSDNSSTNDKEMKDVEQSVGQANGISDTNSDDKEMKDVVEPTSQAA